MNAPFSPAISGSKIEAIEPCALKETIAIVGLGYVGLPVAVALAERLGKAGCDLVGFDISAQRVSALAAGFDSTGEIESERLAASGLQFSDDPACLDGSSFIIVTVPTPITAERRPDLSPLESACALIGPKLKKDAIIVFESTVFPGATEDICGAWLEKFSGLTLGEDFFLGYSPERINPGDKTHRLENITKIIAAQNQAALSRMRAVYGAIIDAPLHEAPSIAVAEAAKVIENTQRDLNIALMNEIALIFDRMGIATKDVLEAASTKWNFLPFSPGLVGGHCIGVDPYYLTAAAERLNYCPEVILAGRRINDSMGQFIAQKTVKLMASHKIELKGARVGIFGLTFKANVGDIRNSKVPDIIRELHDYGIEPLIHDPLADGEAVRSEYGLALSEPDALSNLDALILAVDHDAFLADPKALAARVKAGGVIIDVKSALDASAVSAEQHYWSL